MLSDDTMRRFFSEPTIDKLSIGQQDEVIKGFQNVLSGIRRENENATISELFESGNAAIQQSVS